MKYPNLISEMAKRKVTGESISELLNLHRNSVYYKLNGGTFSVEEAQKIRNAFFQDMSLEELFAIEE